ncbi:MAG: UDP-N-acetylmuramoylalanine-D-glutamate ligase [Parcubacteria group bacterium GW2011_GWB1_45_7]|uniref:UDP-N-acetylmuramoylalanine--D-glutamate ligase n=3 Tax=Parcubacteria group TaxID=1794811 RepID=A0A0H4T6Q0_9BACT|nr:UDP-N-acetylmuramoylalanine--D-glutamate ligase, UDP-N-acetylmuramoylalanine--D-glutamate ligase [uncultured Parcubacteria bacterium Rifle_16ft_4_minimus_37647]KKU11795.1 MAG: UDP-N-acetylmuramoylalanine-D-glutamate ligase [Parcubacteria group bacterium GW2011_GWB1_45_7]OGY58115.1 MAG: UDP-N-acetylmuramoylalanine--D-glutamate ligase [Candidatus Colwellbacteria bacterium RIFCSPHIGHO2_02_FULL_45_17]OGY60493.1 MAG: UDP-N-acetylmuramoylalanine--D-glutamate ligase [Candidatus Colwellbacteria bacte
MKIAILGFGIEGKGTLRFVRNKYPKAEITILDQKKDRNYLKNLDGFDIIFRTPGIPFNTKEIQRAARRGVNVTSATDVFLTGARGTVIGVTGTKGKSTATTLIYEILKRAGRDVYIAGNIGKSTLDLLPKLRKNSIAVLELSSFQLQGVKKSPDVAVILDIFPDHMDHHKSFAEYVNAKSGIVRFQDSNDFVFYVPTNKISTALAKMSAGQKTSVSLGDFPMNLKILGQHNKQNAAVAAAVASRFGVSPLISLEVINKFTGLPYRLRLTRNLGGVSFYNDSASTNPQTTVAALRSFPGKSKILIAGGKDKNLNFKILRTAVNEEDVKAIVLFGECKSKMRKALGSTTLIHSSSNLENAVKTAFRKARPSDIVIFSPGAASFDMFENYRERGDEFDRIVKKLKG